MPMYVLPQTFGKAKFCQLVVQKFLPVALLSRAVPVMVPLGIMAVPDTHLKVVAIAMHIAVPHVTQHLKAEVFVWCMEKEVAPNLELFTNRVPIASPLIK